MLAVLLAAGRGTRMGMLTAHTPKPLLLLRGRPILEHILRGLKAARVDRVVVVTGHLGELIEAHFGDGHALDMRICYRRQGIPQGTARALQLCRADIGDDCFVLSWGDVVVEPALYAELIAEFRRAPCDVLLTINPCDDPWRGAAVYVDGALRVTGLVEKPPRGSSRTTWNNAGLFVFSPLIFDYVERLAPSPRGEYELPQAIAAMLADRRSVRAHPLRGFWSDLGTPEDLANAERSYRPLDERNDAPP
jgi:NDP-sugar pyrophosphorylase family protein